MQKCFAVDDVEESQTGIGDDVVHHRARVRLGDTCFDPNQS
jgi:hypothetical protein